MLFLAKVFGLGLINRLIKNKMNIIIALICVFIGYMIGSFIWFVVQDDETHDYDPSKFDGTIQDFFNERL